MAEIARTASFGKLDPLAYKAIEGATVFCKLRGNPYVELQHWIHQILNNPDSDLHRIVRHYELDAAALASDLTQSLDRLPRGASSISDLSTFIDSAVERGWVYGSLLFGDTRVRTGYLLVGMLKTPTLRATLLSISKQFDRVKVDDLCEDVYKRQFYLSAPDDVAFRLHELLLASALGTWVSAAPAQAAAQWRDSAESLRAVGFDDEHALLPESMRSFSGHRLLQEVAALPQRLLFFEVTDLGARWANVQADEAEIVILFSRADAALEALVDAKSLALHCTPAINLFPKRLDRIVLGPESWEFHAVPDRTKPMDFEVHSLQSVVGHGAGREPPRSFAPLYATHAAAAGEEQAFFTVRREPRRKSERQQLQGSRSAYLGDEVFISLVDGLHGPYREDIRQLAVSAWVTNRDPVSYTHLDVYKRQPCRNLTMQASGSGKSDIFLHLHTKRAGKLKGESKSAGHVDDIQVQSWMWGVSSASAVGSIQATARRSYTALTIFCLLYTSGPARQRIT